MRLSPLLCCTIVTVAVACDQEHDANQRAAKVPVVECSITRVAGGPKKTIKVKIKVEDDAFEGGDLTAFQAHYGFDVQISDNVLFITINEGNFVQDEVGQFTCGEVPKKKGKICDEPIEVDKNLGVEDADEETVKAFDISCRRL